MCTMIAHKLPLPASAKSGDRWFRASHAYLAYDHPAHANLDHALSIDFVNEPGATNHRIERVAVELDLPAAQALHAALGRVLAQALTHDALTHPS